MFSDTGRRKEKERGGRKALFRVFIQGYINIADFLKLFRHIKYIPKPSNHAPKLMLNV